MKIFSEKIYLSNAKRDVTTSKTVFVSFVSGVCLNKFSKTFFMYARTIQVQTEVHIKILQLLVVTYDMGFLRCAIDVVQTVVFYFLC